ncbi:MAG TPA: hypothetical protein VLD39_16115, partial [Gammaproteobacteria bacterium]|nr:hypothetical protein [Gammaproteobacteria bacterium]
TCAVRIARALPVAIAAAALAGAPASHAQQSAATIEAAAEALGMVRGVQRRMDSINTVEFTGTGTLSVPEPGGSWTQYAVTSVTVGMSYHIPALRWDMSRAGADGAGERTIHVVNGVRAWNERQPGVDAEPVDGGVAERRRQIWLTPHGIIRAAVEAEAQSPGSVTVATENGRTTLAVVVDAERFVVTLDANSRPERVATTIEHPLLGRTRLEAVYSGYVDWPLLDVYFPSRIVQTLGEHTILDLTITEFFQNPYVVFPTPEQLARSQP